MRNKDLSRDEEARIIVESIARYLRDEGLEAGHVENALRHLQKEFPNLRPAVEIAIKRNRHLGCSL